MKRRDAEYIGMELADKRRRQRPKIRFISVVRDDMQVADVKEEDAVDRKRWRQLICCGRTPKAYGHMTSPC